MTARDESRSAPESRVKCWKCGKQVRVRKGGALGSHGAVAVYIESLDAEVLMGYCEGSGTKP